MRDNIEETISTELKNELASHRQFSSIHEGLGVIREKYKDLEGEVFNSGKFGAHARMREDAIQLAVQAARFATFIDSIQTDERQGTLLFQETEKTWGDPDDHNH